MRRRRSPFLRKKPKQAKLEEPVLIELHGVQCDGPVTVQIGSEAYLFQRDGAGRLVAPVYVGVHITCFLARPEMYRLAGRR